MNRATLTAARNRAETRFKALGLMAIIITGVFLFLLIIDVIRNAIPSLMVYGAEVAVHVDPARVDRANLAAGDYQGLVKQAWRAQFPEVTERGEKKKLNDLLSPRAGDSLQAKISANPQLIGSDVRMPVLLSSDVDLYLKGWGDGRVDAQQKTWLQALKDKGVLTSEFNTGFLTYGDSREPESAGIRGAFIGSLLVICVTLCVSLPLGVAAALYLEEFAPKNRITDVIEVNINNLAAVPSIIFGLLGLAVFINGLGLPRSTAVVGGLVLALLVLPTIIIAARAAIRSVPPSIKQAALGVGASQQQAVFHHILPLAVPGILTGTILGVARALGETAPLLMIGMIAFIVDIPHGFTDPTTVLPVQVYLWSDLPEAAFRSRTAAAILVLLLLLGCINGVAIYLRNKFERRWV